MNLIEASTTHREGCYMLKRARISALIAMVAAFFGFSGIVQSTAGIAQGVFYCVAAFSALSLVLWLFEEEADTPAVLNTRPLITEPNQQLQEQPSH